MKLVTFSYDDGVTQDQRLINLFDQYGLKGTFNINAGLLGTAGSLIRMDRTVAHVKPRLSEITRIYKDHEVAAHTLHHYSLPDLPDEEVVREVEEDRRILSDAVGYNVVGMAYPNGAVDDRVKALLQKETGIHYARTIATTADFLPQKGDWLAWNGTTRNLHWDEMFRLARDFIDLECEGVQLLYIWGHAYEFDAENSWDRLESFLKLISGHSDMRYCTNREAYEILNNRESGDSNVL